MVRLCVFHILGDMGSEYYILDKGIVEILVYKQGTDPEDPKINEKLAFSKYVGAGVGFGEISLMYNDRRTATVKAVEPCETWVLEGKVFKHIIIKQTVNRRNISLGFLERVPLFSNLDKYEKLKLIDGLESKELTKEEFIIKEGEEGDYFYILEEGTVECIKNSEDSSQEPTLVRTLNRGDHFGELALINNVKRSLSIKVVSDTAKVLALGR